MLTTEIEKLIIRRGNSEAILLGNANLELQEKMIYTIVGTNGTGKTTFIKALTGLLDKRFYEVHGKVLFKGEDLLSLSTDELIKIRKQKIKYVFQDAKNGFDQLKKMKYYFMNLNKTIAEIDETLIYFLLPKLAELSNLHAYEVSGGMAQRISLALAILAKPSLIILDEPTSGIDSAIANLFLIKLKDFVKENSASVLLVTQDLTFAKKISDKIALINNGKLSKFLPPNEFLNSQEILTANSLVNSYQKIRE